MLTTFFSFIQRKKHCIFAGQLFDNCFGSLKVFFSFVVKLLNNKSDELALSWISV